MCNRCNEDPRDDIAFAEEALGGLARLLCELPNNADVPARSLTPLLRIIHDRLDGATTAIQNYVSRV